MKKRLNRNSFIYILEIMLFACIVLVDNARNIGFLGDWKNGNISLGIGVILFGIQILHGGISDCKRISVMIYSVVCFVLILTCKKFFYFIPGVGYYQCLLLILAVWLGGIAGFSLFQKKKLVKPDILVLAWMLFTLLASVSRYQVDFPFFQLIVFGLLYLTLYTKEEVVMLFSRLGTGVTVGFWMLQIVAFGFRPYDKVQYRGLYYNCNVYGMVCMTIIFVGVCKLLEAEQKKDKKMSIVWLMNLFAVYALLWLTIGRALILVTSFGLVLIGCLHLYYIKNLKISKIIRKAMVSLLLLTVSIPLMYCCIRFLPTILKHPVWFGDEYFTKNIVYAGASVDDENYVSLKKYLTYVSGRVSKLWEDNALSPEDESYEERVKIVDPEADTRKYYLGEDYSAIELRIGIAKTYLDKTNLRGHSVEDHLLWVTKHDQMQHAHNIFVQMFFSYGLFSGIAFCAWIILYFINMIRYLRRNKGQWYSYLPMMMFVATIGYGLTDCVWELSQITWVLFLIMQKGMISGKYEIAEKQRGICETDF